MKKIFVMGALACASLLSGVGCSSGGSSAAGGSSASTFNLSGSMSIASSMIMSNPGYDVLSDKFQLFSQLKDTQGQSATQCDDGFYYQVYCLDFSDTPTAKTGNVTCSGTTGSFTVTGLPVNSGIGCFIRKSSDDSSYTTVGNITIPAASLSGDTSTITATGDVALTVAIDSTGTITTTVASGSSNLGETTPPDASSIKLSSGFYKIKCQDTTSAEFSLAECKCRQAHGTYAAYNHGGAKNPTNLDFNVACENDGGAEIPLADTEQFIEMNFYQATPSSDISMENGKVIPSGTHIPVISIWGASDSTTSSRGAGGEGAGTSVGGTTISWDSTQATDAIAWSSGSQTLDGVTFTVGAVPAYTATAGTWIAWVRAMLISSSGWTCHWSTGGVTATEDRAGCLAEFSNFLHNNRSLNIPSFRIDRLCNNSGCDDTVANARIYMEDVKFNYTEPWTATSQAGIVGSMDGVTPKLRTRFVFEPFEATPNGGGGFSQHEWNNRGYECSSSSGKTITNALCDGTHNFVNCGIREEVSIRFVPTATATEFKAIFSTKQSVGFATLDKWTGGTRTMVNTPAVYALCAEQVSNSESSFFLSATKQ